MNRDEMRRRALERESPWDMVIVGGGATGVGMAVDGASRGYEVLLLERADFGKGTSSRSTKLVHGGVRYLEQGNLTLVMEALRERGLLRQNAPHLVNEIAFVVPNYDWWEAPFYGLGLKLYDFLAGKYGFGASEILSREETLERLPTIKTEGLRGGVVYYDGQFDDARLLIHLALTAADRGATLLNYASVTGFTRGPDGFVDGVTVCDHESGGEFTAKARVVVNATGAFADQTRQLADPGVAALIKPSQGIHLVFDRAFLPGDAAIMVPHTSDGRVMFAIPWHGHTLVGTTDTPLSDVVAEPAAQEQEIDFLLETAGQYLHHAPSRADVLSVFVGIRPLVGGGSANTAALSRDHTIHIDNFGMLTIAGGKWTTYRRMAEDGVNQAATLGRLADRACITQDLAIHAYEPKASAGDAATDASDSAAAAPAAASDAAASATTAAAATTTADAWTARITRAVRNEMARTVEDCLARRTRTLFLNAAEAVALAPRVATILAQELGRDEAWQQQQVRDFTALARQYQLA